MQIFAREVYSGMVDPNGVDIDIPDADYLVIQTLSLVVRASGVADTLTIAVRQSQDRLNWTTYQTPINGVSIDYREVTSHAGYVDGAVTAGPSLRLRATASTDTVAHVRIFVNCRVKKRNPMCCDPQRLAG